MAETTSTRNHAGTGRTRREARGGSIATALACSLVFACVASAQQSGLQITPDGQRTLVNKDVGGERWAIDKGPDGRVTGNVFFPDGREPQFVWCDVAEGATVDENDELMFSCFGGDPCLDAPCPPEAWSFIADVSLPASFFEPPSTPAGWRALPPLPVPRQEHPTIAFEDEIWVLGGFDDRANTLDSVHAYDTATGTWRTDIAPIPRAMHHANVAAVDGKVYITGHLVEGGFAASGQVFEYDPREDEWIQKTSMPNARRRGASATGAIDGKIYVAGGLRAGTRAEFSSYDPASDSWEPLPDLPQSLDHAGAAVVGGKFYVLGGRSGGIAGVSGAVHIYDPAEGEWAQGAEMPTPRGGVAAAVAGGKIYVMGGEGNPNTESGVWDDVEVYDPATNTWDVLPPMAVPRHGMGAAAIGNHVYVPGGATREGFGVANTFDVLQLD